MLLGDDVNMLQRLLNEFGECDYEFEKSKVMKRIRNGDQNELKSVWMVEERKRYIHINIRE